MNLRSIGFRSITAASALGAVVALTATVAGAQTALPGGPFASGMVTSISGSTLQLQRPNPDDQSQMTDVSVTLTGSTTYQKVQPTAADAISTGSCVRVAGKGSVAKGKITASTVAITGASGSDCTRPRGNGAGPGAANAPGGTTANGSNPPSGSFPRNGNGRRRPGGFALGSVQSVNGNKVVVKAAELSGRRQSGGSQMPSIKTKNVKVTLSNSTTVTQLVGAAQTDLAAGQCVSAAGTGDAEAITAQRVTISQPVNGACTGFGFGGGPMGDQGARGAST